MNDLLEMLVTIPGRILSAFGVPSSQIGIQWALIQLAMIAIAYGVAVLITRWTTPTCEKMLRGIHGQPQLLRVLIVILRRLKWIILAILLWMVLLSMREVTWWSRSYLISIAANMTAAWAVISIFSRLIRNRLLASSIALFAWIVAALSILNLLSPAMDLLDTVGINLQGVRLTPLLVIKSILTISVMIWLATTISRFANNRLKASEDISPSLQVLLGKLIKAILVVVAFLAALSVVGIDFTALAVFSGAIGLGIGFGLQKVVSNLLSGIILLVDKSIKPGDVISVGDTYGRINELAARYASVVSRNGREYLIPNEDLITSQVINWSYSNPLVRLDLDFGVSYEANPHLVRQLAKDVAAKHKRVQAVPPSVCHITEFGDSSINYKLRFWIRDPDKGTVNVRGDLFLMLWDALTEAGIEIPYPHRDVAMRGPVKLEISEFTPAPKPAKKPRAPKQKN